MWKIGTVLSHASSVLVTLGQFSPKLYSSLSTYPRICVVGSGPAGFGIAQYLLKNHDTVNIHMVEKCPIPYGLIRYGVSPDHQDVKNCIHGYEKVAENPRFTFLGNVAVGEIVSLDDLARHYNAIVLCTGAQKVQTLGIQGENFQNVFSSKEFVGWYNGDPEYQHITPDLSGGTATIIGVGNVALDCARMLLKSHGLLKETDVTAKAYEVLSKSNVKKVHIVGRRGPLQMACTRRELSEITDLEDVRTVVDANYFTDEVKRALKIKDLKLRKTQRLVKYLMNVTKSEPESAPKEFNLKLLRTPLKIIGEDQTVQGLLTQKNSMSGNDGFNPVIQPMEETEKIDCSIVISCIGYKNEALEGSIPFENGKIISEKGKVTSSLPIYACGWCKTGPKGVLADTLNDCLVTGGTILQDMDSLSSRKLETEDTLFEKLGNNGTPLFSWDNWKTLDNHEIENGVALGKVREKVTSVDEMLKIAFKHQVT